MEREAVIFGAGRIGRGFLAEVFLSAGCRLTFVDMSNELVQSLLDRGQYTIFKAMSGGLVKELVWGYDALLKSDERAIADRLSARGAIAAVSVSPDNFNDTVQLLAVCIAQKALLTPDEPLDILLCLNMIDPVGRIRDNLESLLGGAALEYMQKHVGLINTVVMRMTPPTPPELLEEDPISVLNNGYPELVVDGAAFRGVVPTSPMIRPSDDIAADEARKFFTFNMIHAAIAYLGADKGYSTAVKSLGDKDIRPVLNRALDEAAQGLCGEYGFSEESMRVWNTELMAAMDNALLDDHIERLGADSARKLGSNDRLVGAANMCAKHGGKPEALARVIAAGYRYTASQDAGTLRVQESVYADGIEAAVERFSDIAMRHPLHDMVIEAWERRA